MAIPKLYDITAPLLQIYNDHEIHSRSDMAEHVSNHFNMTDEERRKLKPSGGETLINNRCGWARFELKKAGLLEQLTDKTYKITSSGLEILKSNPTEINRKFLMTIPTYSEYVNKQKEGDEGEDIISATVDENASPEDLMNVGWKKYQKELESDILEKVKSNHPDFFEKLVVDLIQKMGYGKGTVTGKSGDGGIDGVIEGDKLGLELILLQAKRYQGTVPVGDVKNFAGSLDSKKSKKGIFLTTSDFSHDAKKFVEDISSKIILINGKRLAELMFEHNVGFSSGVKMELKTIDEDYFSD